MYLAHYGTPKHSGRYPFGSGKRPFQRAGGGHGRNESAKKRLSKMDDQDLANYTKRKENENKYIAGEAAKYDVASKGLKSSEQVARGASNAIAKTSRRKKEKIVNEKFDLSKMSDQDLQREVNRMNLEKNFKNLKKEQISLGRDTANEYLDIAGDIVGVVGNAASVAMAIYIIKNKL